MAMIKPRTVTFSTDVMERMWRYVEEQVDYLLEEGDMFRTNTLPEWTRQLKGRPKEPVRNFPFPNASNLVVQLIATRVEQMLSRAMTIYMTDPLWTVTALGDLVGAEGDEQAKMLEQFMSDQAIDPEELALYRKEELMFHDGIAYGTAFMGFPWQYITEHEAVEVPGVTAGINRASEFKEFIKRDGPSPENIPIERVLISNRVTDITKAKFVAIERQLSREAVEDRIAFGVWSREIGEKILRNPSPEDSNIAQTQDTKQIVPSNTGSKWGNVYKIYECYFKFVHDKKTFSIIAHFHRETKGKCSVVFNYFPKNTLPIEDMRFGYDDDQYFGYGFIEMLSGYQQEVSQLHNNRLDNEAIRNNVTFRINKDTELASTLRFYPGVTVPADKDEVEVLETAAGGALDNGASEQAATSMANERSGIDPATSGLGSGIVNPKRGIYSSQGTMAVLQQQNNRTGLRMMDVRGVHVKIGRKLLDLYANFGIGQRLARYGDQGPMLRKAIDSVRAGNLGLLLKASSASSNVESDRQNSVLLSGLQEKYIATVNQILQAMGQAQVDQNQKQWLEDILFAQQSLTRDIFRSFGKYDVDKLVPFPEFIKNARFQQQQASAGNAQRSAGGSQQPQNVVPIASGQQSGIVPSSTPQQQAG